MGWSVVIPSGDPDNLDRCVSRLLDNQPDLDPSRIVVVEDRAQPEAEPRSPQPFRRLAGPRPFVFARNVNLGAAACAPDDTILMADDVELMSSRGFDRLARVAREHPEIGLLAASVVGPVGNERQKHDPDRPLTTEPEWISFICVWIPRSTWNAVGPMDESLIGYGYDDVDYSWRVRAKGLSLATCNLCQVGHNVDIQSVYRSREDFHQIADHNRMLFRRKWNLREDDRAVP